jgi:hypothetical protein
MDKRSELLHLYDSADEWGQRLIMAMARRYQFSWPAPEPRLPLRLVHSQPVRNDDAHLVNNVVNGEPLTRIGQPVDRKQS